MRVFIAIELNEELKENLFNIQQIVKKYSLRGNFSRKENFHLTLRFIGETQEEEIDALKKAIDETAKESVPFNIKLEGLGYFPKKNKKIIWIGIKEGKNKLQELFNKLENKIEKYGFEKEIRGLKPHITLAREVKLNREFNYISNTVEIDSRDIPVMKISLMQSTRIDGILTYIPIYCKAI